MDVKTTYFEITGEENTGTTLSIVRQRAEELSIKKVVIASNTGNSAVKALDVLAGLKVIVVTHVVGFREPDSDEFKDENRKIIQDKGGVVLTTAHAFAGLSTATRDKQNMSGTGVIIADTLRIFGQGMKVACEISLMAADSGLIRTDEDVISIGGSKRGSDTAIVLTPTNTRRFFDLKVREILCKPRL